ncbi:MAG: hypothetical protein K2J39_08530 [Ruminococcus sp.]|nr:hypothetical protein [Ruminococcus sp.]
MFEGYKFEENGKKLIQVEINFSFGENMYFQICENENNYIAYWRTEPEKYKRDEFMCKAVCLFPELMPLSELVKITEYKELLKEYSLVYSAVLNENQKNIIDMFLKNGIDKDVHEPHGRDGRSYFIEVYYPEYRKYSCWCILPEEWSVLADVINILVDVSQADFQRYGAKIYKKNFISPLDKSEIM